MTIAALQEWWWLQSHICRWFSDVLGPSDGCWCLSWMKGQDSGPVSALNSSHLLRGNRCWQHRSLPTSLPLSLFLPLLKPSRTSLLGSLPFPLHLHTFSPPSFTLLILFSSHPLQSEAELQRAGSDGQSPWSEHEEPAAVHQWPPALFPQQRCDGRSRADGRKPSQSAEELELQWSNTLSAIAEAEESDPCCGFGRWGQGREKRCWLNSLSKRRKSHPILKSFDFIF